MKQHLLLGTAGHIDHGKTALVRALTGVDTDRLPEERQRQITIDLGFAALELDEFAIGIVDVPGHERFVKNMLAGAAGVDLAMLVVAADDSVKPQTREHLDILKYLRLKAGVIVLTKCDLAEPDWLELVEAEVRELVAGSFLAAAPLVRVSSVTGTGLDELREAIAQAAARVQGQQTTEPVNGFRMAVDRVFTIAGHGTVVTGSVASGVVRVGDKLELQPQAQTVRVRGLQTNDTAVETIGRGQRAAINLGGVRYDEISRGQSLASCGMLRASRLLTVELSISDQLSRAVKDRSAVRVHLGTASIPARLSLLGSSAVEPGATTFAQLILAEEVATAWGQPLVLRSVSPVETLGGGRVLDPQARRIKRLDEALRKACDALASDDTAQRAAAAAFFAGTDSWQPSDLEVLAGVDNASEIVAKLVEVGTLQKFAVGKDEIAHLHAEIVDQLWQRVEQALTAEHGQRPLRKFVEQSRLAKHFRRLSASLFVALCLAWQEQEKLRCDTHGIALADWSPQLTVEQQELLSRLEGAFHAADFQPPSFEQLADEWQTPVQVLAELIGVAVEAGTLVRISSAIYLDREVEQRVRRLLTEQLAGSKSMSVSEIRELLGTTRKVAVPLCEYLDGIGFTTRQGDTRRLAQPEGVATQHA